MNVSLWRHTFLKSFCIQRSRAQNILSKAYSCEEAWHKRLESPVLNSIQMSQYFIATDKKFGTKRLASGVDIDLFANCVKNEEQLEELEHLMFRFRKTKRAVEMMDSTTYAVSQALLRFGNSETLFRILENRESYGVFPDHFSYNIFMDNFLDQKLYKDAARIATLMMLQENFSNQISQILGLYSCEKFISECSLNSLNESPETESNTEEQQNEVDEDELTLVRVPFLRNPWFDDHFNIENPSHLIGKTFYLIGREMNDVVGRTYQIIGLAMYEKWEKLIDVLQSMLQSDITPSVLSDGVQKVKEYLDALPEEDKVTKESILNKIEDLFVQLKEKKKIVIGNQMDILKEKLSKISELEKKDIEHQQQLFIKWESERQSALKAQNEDIDREKRLKAIEEKKEYLFWKEKLLFFFENEEKILDELKKVEEVISEQKSKKSLVDTYVPPEIIKKPQPKITRFMKLTRVKKL